MSAHCIYDTTGINHPTNYGVDHGDEMCAFIMFYYPANPKLLYKMNHLCSLFPKRGNTTDKARTIVWWCFPLYFSRINLFFFIYLRVVWLIVRMSRPPRPYLLHTAPSAPSTSCYFTCHVPRIGSACAFAVDAMVRPRCWIPSDLGRIVSTRPRRTWALFL